MKILKGELMPIETLKIIHGMPGTGKTWLLGSGLRLNMIDTDPMLRTVTPDPYWRFVVESGAPQAGTPQERLPWTPVELNAALNSLWSLIHSGTVLVTNQFMGPAMFQLTKRGITLPTMPSITFAHKPEFSLVNQYERARRYKNTVIEMSPLRKKDVETAKVWYQSWLDNDQYDVKVLLDDGEFISSTWGITPVYQDVAAECYAWRTSMEVLSAVHSLRFDYTGLYFPIPGSELYLDPLTRDIADVRDHVKGEELLHFTPAIEAFQFESLPRVVEGAFYKDKKTGEFEAIVNHGNCLIVVKSGITFLTKSYVPQYQFVTERREFMGLILGYLDLFYDRLEVLSTLISKEA
jgi:hypothetical protein